MDLTRAHTQRVFHFAFWLIPALATSSVAGVETELPRTAVYQAVIPEIGFRTSHFPKLETQLLVINSHADLTLVELELFFADGSPAAEFFTRSSQHTGFGSWSGEANVGFSKVTGKFYNIIPPHSLLTIVFPGVRNPLTGEDFSGWARLRSNRPIAVVQTTRVTAGPPFEGHSEVRQTASLGPTGLGRVSVGTWRCEFRDTSNPHQPAGYVTRKSGVTLTNPHESETSIRLQIDNRSRELVLPPRNKQSFLIDELFTFSYGTNCGAREQMEIIADEGPGFATSVLEVIYAIDVKGRPVAAGADVPIYFEDPWNFRMPIASEYAFPEEVLHQLQFGEHKISLTRFGFVIRSGGETPEDRVFAYPVGGTAADLVGLVMPPEQDFAFVYGSGRQTAVVFSSGRVEFSDSDGCCGSAPTFERLEPQLARISLAITCAFVRITVDTEQEKIVGTDVISDPNVTCF